MARYKIGFFGAGKMAEGILSALPDKTEVIMSEKVAERRQELEKKYPAKVVSDLKEVASSAKIVFLSVKPQDVDAVAAEVKKLISAYNSIETKTFEDIIDFHYRFEKIHPFQDGNGRVGRLLLFKECLKYGFVPFIIDEELKMFYYRGLSEWQRERGYLIDTCLAAQDKFKRYLDYFRVPYNN